MNTDNRIVILDCDVDSIDNPKIIKTTMISPRIQITEDLGPDDISIMTEFYGEIEYLDPMSSAVNNITIEDLIDKDKFSSSKTFKLLNTLDRSDNYLVVVNLDLIRRGYVNTVDEEGLTDYRIIELESLVQNYFTYELDKGLASTKLNYLRYLMNLNPRITTLSDELKIQRCSGTSDFDALTMYSIVESLILSLGSTERLYELSRMPIIQSVLNFGKNKGKTYLELMESSIDYLDWLFRSRLTKWLEGDSGIGKMKDDIIIRSIIHTAEKLGKLDHFRDLTRTINDEFKSTKVQGVASED